MRASIYHTANGWSCRIQREMGYYSTLGEAMAAAYGSEDGAANHIEVSAVRDRPCDDCRFAKGSGFPGTCQGDKTGLS